MKLTVDRKQFQASFEMAAGFASPRSPQPIMQQVKLVADDPEPVLMATDGQQSAVIRVLGAKVEDAGQVILPTSDIMAILKASTDASLVIEEDQRHNILVLGSSSEFELSGINPNLFPEPPQFPAGGYYVAKAADFKRAIRRTSYACTPVASKSWALAGICMEFDLPIVRLAATDERRLGEQVCDIEAEGDVSGLNTRPVVPEKLMSLLARNIGDDDPPVHFLATKKQFLVRTELATISGSLCEGRFPNYRMILPSNPVANTTIKVADLKAASQQGSVMTCEETHGVIYEFAPGNLTIRSQRHNGRSKVVVPIAYDGPVIAPKFDPKYLLDMLKMVGDDVDLTIGLVDAQTAVTLRSNDGFLYAVMVMGEPQK